MYFCAFGVLIFLPLAYLVCQVMTFVVYEGKWRRRSLWPILVVLIALVPLIFWRDEWLISSIMQVAPMAGLIALSCIWSAYTREQDKASVAED